MIKIFVSLLPLPSVRIRFRNNLNPYIHDYDNLRAGKVNGGLM